MMVLKGRRYGRLLLAISGLSLVSGAGLWVGCSQERGLASLQAEKLEGVYVSKVEKSVQVPFYNRFARPNYHVVVTDQAVTNAVESVYVPIPEGKDVAFIETPLFTGENVPGEIARVEGIRVVIPPVGEDMHQYGRVSQHSGEFLGRVLTYPSPLPLTEAKFASEVSQANLGAITRQNLELRLRQLSGEIPVDIDGKKQTIGERRGDQNRTLVRTWLKAEYEKLGYKTSLDVYGTGPRGTNANFVAEKPGRDPNKYILVTSHLDSVGNPGADDNGAGTISALAVAEVLSKVPLNYGIKFIAFDQEELGLVGSKSYARRHDLKDLIGVINVEMTSFDSDGDGAIHVIDCNENQSARITNIFTQLLTDKTRNLKVVDACTNRSDHASFWRYNKPAIIISQNFFGGDDNPCYHRGCDRVDRVNYDYMVRVTNLVKDAVYGLATDGI